MLPQRRLGAIAVLEGSFKAHSGSVNLICGEGKCVTGANSAHVTTDLELAFCLLAGHGWNVRWLTPLRKGLTSQFSGAHIPKGRLRQGAAPKLSSTHSKLRMIGRDENELDR